MLLVSQLLLPVFLILDVLQLLLPLVVQRRVLLLLDPLHRVPTTQLVTHERQDLVVVFSLLVTDVLFLFIDLGHQVSSIGSFVVFLRFLIQPHLLQLFVLFQLLGTLLFELCELLLLLHNLLLGILLHLLPSLLFHHPFHLLLLIFHSLTGLQLLLPDQSFLSHLVLVF
mmetsp:Transcript_42614/g.40893  ORF Transcript_42614/g.40893 Transcript_42614/m.40893 type:complete len:169 (+) Transcript_42614:332-838(+)